MPTKRLPDNSNPEAAVSYAGEKTTTKRGDVTGVGYDNDAFVPICEIDFTKYDSLDDCYREAEDKEEFLQQLGHHISEERLGKLLLIIVSMFHNEKRDIGLNVDVLVEIFDLPFNGGKSYRDLGQRHGITVEAFCKRMEKLINELGVRGPRNFKRNKKKKQYDLTNHTNDKKIYD